VLPAQAVARHVVGDILSGLAAETTEDDLLLRFRYYAEDSELFNLGETGEGWLRRILPVREELLSGNMDALELGRLIGEYGIGSTANLICRPSTVCRRHPGSWPPTFSSTRRCWSAGHPNKPKRALRSRSRTGSLTAPI